MTETQIFSRALVPVSSPDQLLENMLTYLKEHDVHIATQDGVSTAAMPEFGVTIALKATAQGLEAHIGAPSEGHLHFMREELIEHTEKFDPVAAEAIRWDDRAADPVRPVNFYVFKVVDVRDVINGLRRVTLEGPATSALEMGGLHLRIILPKNLERTPVWPRLAPNGGTQWPEDKDELHARILTIRSIDTATHRIELDIVVHNDGFVSEWARSTQPGREVGIMGPGGEKGPPVNGPYLFVGDRTALAAMARNLDVLDDSSAVTVIAALPDPNDASRYFDGVQARVVGVSEAELNEGAVSLIKREMGSDRLNYAWFGGEFSCAQSVRKFFREDLALGKGQQLSVAYWRRGHAGES